jgi:trehalose 2-sulfotransferase
MLSRWFGTNTGEVGWQQGIRKLRPSLSYLICCSERTGSTLLGNALIGTGIAGRPRSYFNRVAPYNPRIRRILGNAKDDDEYLNKVIVTATTSNGVFGAKVHWDHFLNLIAKAERGPKASEGRIPTSVPERLQLHFPDLRYVWLVRANAVARAISHYRVKKTNRWQVDSRWVTDDTGGEGEPDFDFDKIAAFARAGETEDARWRRFFQARGIAPLELIYEEMVKDLEGTVRHVLKFLGIPAENVKVPAPTLHIQADDYSRDWETRYRQMRAEENE